MIALGGTDADFSIALAGVFSQKKLLSLKSSWMMILSRVDQNAKNRYSTTIPEIFPAFTSLYRRQSMDDDGSSGNDSIDQRTSAGLWICLP